MSSRAFSFVKWYFTEKPLGIVQTYSQYACALLDVVPLGFLLKTLFSPWKNIVERTPRHGLDISLIFEAFCLGLLARGVGCVVRLLTIALGLILHIILLGLTAAYLVLWLAFPLISLFGLVLLFQMI
jgi:ABC-type glycerol-3-phosphate transport system permease component